MRKRNTSVALCLAALVCSNVLFVEQARALGSVIAGGGAAVNGGTTTVTADTPGSLFDGFVGVYAFLEADKSYACTALAAFPTDVLSIDTAVTAVSVGTIDNTANGVSLRGDVTPRVTGNNVAPATITDDRIVIVPTTPDNYLFNVRNASATDAVSMKFEYLETTLYGGYNTNANPFNFLELTNTTASTIAGRVRGYNYDGTPTVDTTFSIGANNRFDVILHSAATTNKYGTLVVTHNGPYGALQGAVAQYNGTVGALELSTTTQLKPREQTF